MDSNQLILTQPVLPPTPLQHTNEILLQRKITKLQQVENNEVTEQERKQIAKDFESILIHKLLQDVKNTIVSSIDDENGLSQQVGEIFWLYLADYIANNGGLGIWKDIYQFLINHSNQSNPITKLQDERL